MLSTAWPTLCSMTYRDDRDADRARIEALEAELAGARRRVSELEGRREQALVVASGGALVGAPRSVAKTWLGAPLELGLTHEFPGAFPVDSFEDLIEPIRAIVRDPGRTEILKSSMTWTNGANPKGMGPFLVVMVSVRDGVTKLSVSDRLGQAAGVVYGGFGAGVGGGAVIAPIGLGMLIGPIAVPFLVAGWLGASWWGSRKIFQRIARRRATLMQQVFDALVKDIDAAIARA
jgi:hypothetical protein